MVLGKLDSHMQKNEVGPWLHTVYKNSLQMDRRPKHKIQKCKTLKRKYKGKSMILNLLMIIWIWNQKHKEKKKDKSTSPKLKIYIRGHYHDS